ncbi:EAL domain-containing protein (putative c-di-GMP-specific phosphodiesterase class I) [Silvibacterium bohemicum]|uniref:EAL domain-containing protein (Putative c-di-GMP-specific phosphodiesterase class I) n=1 Tax=Silvibacterium bohemicum TaxID=1577686 RepID=A0A841JRL4_9BACT|nr:EAL domain-containing protein [Silvibacterium bohemicum]MBB6142419.1 EAL domain-containing protein (putative c-di-GMP-specific phosphodiesterase class I) [Silvibacterium bohemicum]
MSPRNEVTANFRCVACKDGVRQPFPFSMAFQPIVDIESRTVYAYEALVRGLEGQSAAAVLCRVTPENRYAFDQSCRVRAISLAAQLGLAKTEARLSINFLPRAVLRPSSCIQLTLQTAQIYGLAHDRIILEMVETEEAPDLDHLRRIVNDYRQRGLKVALDDFGAAHSGLNLLADLPTDIIKLDKALIRNLSHRSSAMAIVMAMAKLSRTMGVELIAEGVETLEEYEALRRCGISLMQGYLFAKPVFEALPEVNWPEHFGYSGKLAKVG